MPEKDAVLGSSRCSTAAAGWLSTGREEYDGRGSVRARVPAPCASLPTCSAREIAAGWTDACAGAAAAAAVRGASCAAGSVG